MAAAWSSGKKMRGLPGSASKSSITTNATIDAMIAAGKSVSSTLTKVRSVANKELNRHVYGYWGKRMFEVMIENGNASDEFKSAALLEYFEAELGGHWLYCKYLSVLLECFTIGMAPKSNMGSYRVELIVLLFHRLVDLHNFEFILMNLNSDEHAAVLARIGILNIFNPCKPEGGWQFDLLRWDERQVVKMMIHLSVVEPGENWYVKSLRDKILFCRFINSLVCFPYVYFLMIFNCAFLIYTAI